MEKGFYKEISFLPAAAVNPLEVQQAAGFKGEAAIPPRLPAARQLSADLRSKVSVACGARGGKHPSGLGFGWSVRMPWCEAPGLLLLLKRHLKWCPWLGLAWSIWGSHSSSKAEKLSGPVWRKADNYCSAHGNGNSRTARYCSGSIHQIRKGEEISVWDKLNGLLHFLLVLKRTFICWKGTGFAVPEVLLVSLNWDTQL